MFLFNNFQENPAGSTRGDPNRIGLSGKLSDMDIDKINYFYRC